MNQRYEINPLSKTLNWIKLKLITNIDSLQAVAIFEIGYPMFYGYAN